MADEATQVMLINASPERCYEVAADFERYPEWAADIKSVEVLDHDEAGRPSSVTFRAAGFGRSTSYTLRYDYGEAPRVLAWAQTAGDITDRLDGAYVFASTATDPPVTEVTYHLAAHLKLPIPGFVKRRAEGRIIHTALRELKAKVEASE